MDIAQDGNLFPREDILEAVAQSDWRDQPARPWAWALASLGVFCVSLGWPIVDPLTASTVEHSASHPVNLLHPLHTLSAWLGPMTGLGIEFVWYALSSLCLALSLPALGAAVRALGLGPRLAFVMALVGVLSPELWAHGRLPSDFPAGVLGTSLLLAMTLAPSDDGPSGHRGYGLRVAATLCFAALLHGGSLACAPAAIVAAWQRGAGRAALPVALTAAVVSAAVFMTDWSSGTASALGRGAPVLILAYSPLLAFVPLAFASDEEESPPPLWLVVWLACAAACTAVLLLAPGSASTLPMLLPVLVVLAAAALARRARPDGALRLAGGLALAQVILLGLLHWSAPAQEARGLSAAGPELFRDGDVVYVPAADLNGRVAYLLRRRFNVKVIGVEGSVPKEAKASPTTEVRRRLSFGAIAGQTPFVLDAEAGTVAPHE